MSKEIGPQTIIRLQAENVKKLVAITVTPKGNVVSIGGKNAQGKTTTIDAIVMAMAGKRAIPSKPVRTGQDKAVIVLETQDYIVRRTIGQREDGSSTTTLTVSNKDGAQFPSPQALLDQLLGDIGFDPGEFYRKHPSEQQRIVKELVGLDFTAADAKRKEFFDQRTIVNRDVKSLQSRLAVMRKHDKVPEKEQSAAEITARMQKASEENQKILEAQAKPDIIQDQLDNLTEEIKEATDKIERLKVELQKLEDERTVLLKTEQEQRRNLKEAIVEVGKLPDAVDLSSFQTEIQQLEETNRKVRENNAYNEVSQQLAAKEAEAKGLGDAIDLIDRARVEDLSKAEFPIKGLSFDEQGTLIYNGIPLEQASAAEQIRVAMAIALALNPKLKVVLIRDASIFDSETKAIVAQMAEEAGAQVWEEIVAERDEHGNYPKNLSVIIEDGQVVQ